MSVLHGLHGTIAVLLLCALLFIDEGGLPLPIAPNEVLLLIAGLLIATGAMPAWVFLPAAALAMTAGMLLGYSWARAAGSAGLETLARRMGVARAYQRSRQRLQRAGPVGIAISRLVPGVRPYATLVSGAARVDLRTFLLGALPALLLWEAVLTALGMLVGLPAERFLTQFQQLGFRGALLVILGGGSYLAVRRVPSGDVGALAQLPLSSRLALALTIDTGIVSSIVAGLLAIARRLMGLRTRGWIDLVVVVAIVVVGYVLAARRGAGGTAGEALLRVDFRTLRATVRGRRSARGTVVGQQESEAKFVAGLLRPLADPVNVRIVSLLGQGDRELGDVLTSLRLPGSLIALRLDRMERAGLIRAQDRDGRCLYHLVHPGVVQSIELLGQLARRSGELHSPTSDGGDVAVHPPA